MLSVGRPRCILTVVTDAFCMREMLAFAVVATARLEERHGDALRRGKGDLGMKNVLIADAHNAFRQCLAALLEEQASLGTVAEAGSLAEARRVLPDVGHNVDLAVVSLDLPDLDAQLLIEDLHAIGIPVLALTFQPDPERRARTLRAGADEVLGMGSSSEELVREASRLVEG
jgi:DNA-binding NarL/FixJ family response regulator